MDPVPFLRELQSPVTADQLRPLSPVCRSVQFLEPLTESDHEQVAAFLRDYPEVTLRAYGHYRSACNLDFLRHYPNVRRLAIELYTLVDLEGFAKYASPDLTSLALGKTKRKTHSLAFLQRFPRLESLFLEGHTKDIQVLGTLTNLADLGLRSITLPDLAMLKPLKSLRSLDIKLGGTRNLDALPEIGRLRYLELWMIRGLTDLGALGAVRTLQYLFLQSLKTVTEIPSFARLQLLRRVHLETMKGLSDLQPVAEAPALEELVATAMPQLEPANFNVFVGHPTLRRASVHLGSTRKNRAIAELLRLPDASHNFQFQDAAAGLQA